MYDCKVIEHHGRRLIHYNVTADRSAQLPRQQLRDGRMRESISACVMGVRRSAKLTRWSRRIPSCVGIDVGRTEVDLCLSSLSGPPRTIMRSSSSSFECARSERTRLQRAKNPALQSAGRWSIGASITSMFFSAPSPVARSVFSGFVRGSLCDRASGRMCLPSGAAQRTSAMADSSTSSYSLILSRNFPIDATASMI